MNICPIMNTAGKLLLDRVRKIHKMMNKMCDNEHIVHYTRMKAD